MIRHRQALTIISVLLLLTLLSMMLAGPAAATPPEKVRVLISFRSPPGPAEQALVHRAGGSIRYTYRLVPAIAATLPETAIAHLQANPGVLRVEPDLQMHALDAELESAWGVAHIGAGIVHDSGNKGTGVRVAVIDSGVDYDHPDLDGNYQGGVDFVEGDGDPMDVYGHGTHVAGTICAEDNDSDNDSGVVGVAPDCDLYALRVLDDNGYGYASELIAAMEWASGLNDDQIRIQVANLSLGWDRDPGATVQAAFDNAAAGGMVIVAAAGNSGNPRGKGDNVCYPAKYDSVIAVAATDAQDQRASFSSTGSAVELAAPGVAVLSTWNDSDSPLNPQPVYDPLAGGYYKEGSGTSMASPHVAGVAALLIASGVTDSDAVRQRLRDSAVDLGATGLDPQYGYGRVDAAAAVGTTPPSPDPVTDIAVTSVDAPSSVTQGSEVSVVVTLANVGTVNVGEIIVSLDDATDGVRVGQESVSGLPEESTVAVTFIWNTAGASGGTHTLHASHDFADDYAGNDTQSVQVTVNEPSGSLAVTGISPETIPGGTTTTVDILGAGFQQGATVSFANGAGPAPVASVTDVSADGSTITVEVTTKATPKTRTWDVRVTNPDGSSAVLPGGLAVTP